MNDPLEIIALKFIGDPRTGWVRLTNDEFIVLGSLVETLEARTAALSAGLQRAHAIAVDRAFERERSDQPDGKMQGATAAVIANDILAVLQELGIAGASDDKGGSVG